MPQANRVCKTCGKNYFFCSNCDKTLNSPQWMLMWCSENCKAVFEIVSDYAQKRLSKQDAKKKLEKCNLKVEYTFTEKIRNYIEEIMAEEKVETKEVKPIVETKKVENSSKNTYRRKPNRRG